jgi:hypothetical protein
MGVVASLAVGADLSSRLGAKAPVSTQLDKKQHLGIEPDEVPPISRARGPVTIATDRKALQPSSSGDAEKAAGALLTEHPKLNAIWASAPRATR